VTHVTTAFPSLHTGVVPLSMVFILLVQAALISCLYFVYLGVHISLVVNQKLRHIEVAFLDGEEEWGLIASENYVNIYTQYAYIHTH
jgi:hypothetical protein